ncbi:MAG: hypothetical protein PVG30_00640 [Gammaproteobacteria bacterium]|jgi:uncharacterized membrane protein YhaH (DUF805 family)
MRNYLSLLFSFRGQITRLKYFQGTLGQWGIMLCGAICLFLPALFSAAATSMDVQAQSINALQSNQAIPKLITATLFLVGFVFFIMAIVAKFSLDIKRLRNMGWSTRWILIRLLPLIAIFHIGIIDILTFFLGLILTIICFSVPSRSKVY